MKSLISVSSATEVCGISMEFVRHKPPLLFVSLGREMRIKSMYLPCSGGRRVIGCAWDKGRLGFLGIVSDCSKVALDNI